MSPARTGRDPRTGRYLPGHPGGPGARPAPVGTTRTHCDRGEVLVRVAHAVMRRPNGNATYWRPRRLEVWEAHRGPVPAGHCVIRLDPDPTCDDIDGLMCVPRAVLVRLNRAGGLGRLPADRELRRTAVLAAVLYQLTFGRGRELEAGRP